MKRMKGMGLLLLANILIFVTLSISFTILSEFVLPAFGIDLLGSIAHTQLLWAFVIGFGGGIYQFGLFQANGKGHDRLLPNHPTPEPG